MFSTPSRLARLILEDGSVYCGDAVGAEGLSFGEIVFNTSSTGYQEILTDPSYKSQIILMTYPEIGNYGVNSSDFESKTIHASGFVVSRLSPYTSSWRAEYSLRDFLNKKGIVAIEGVDTRSITLNIREKGSMKAAIVSDVAMETEEVLLQIRSQQGFDSLNPVASVTTKQPQVICNPANQQEQSKKIQSLVILDLGLKTSIVHYLSELVETLYVLPADSSFEDICAYRPQGVLLSNGPGDPQVLKAVIEVARKLIESAMPTFGICLGHQVLGLACGARISKMRFGHHGSNHPVKDLRTNSVFMTSQNHGYHAEFENFPTDQLTVTHVNLNDGSIEGFKHTTAPVMSVQFHPEANPGPQDANYIFEEFMTLCR
jgi:carbamoyl-phosphate synthase small subunit